MSQQRIPAVYMRGGTSKIVVIGPSRRSDRDVDFLFAAVAIDTGLVDYSGNCGNLSAVLEDGAFNEDGVTFCAAEVRLEFHGSEAGAAAAPLAPITPASMFPTGAAQEILQVPGVGALAVTLICAGNPTVFVRAQALGLTGRELSEDVNRDRRLLETPGTRARARRRVSPRGSARSRARSRSARRSRSMAASGSSTRRSSRAARGA